MNLASFERFAGKRTVELQQKSQGTEAVIYTRVSSKEQADKNLSLETQRKAIEEYARRYELPVAAYFGGTYESAKTDGRKEFQRMLQFIQQHSGRIGQILVYTLDRFSRTGGAAIKLAQDLREKYGVRVFAVTQPTDTSNPSGILHQNIQLLFSEYDNQLRKQKAVAGLKEKFEKGIWATRPPQGYDIVKINGERKLVINDVGEKLRMAFQWKAEGMKNEMIIARLQALGVPMYKQQLTKLLKKPFYCGIINHGLLEGRVVEANHEPLISRELFLCINGEKTSAHARRNVPLRKENNHLPLKVFLRCQACGAPFTGYHVKTKGLYYYKCRTEGCRCNRNADQLHQLFEQLLETIVLKPEWIPALQYQLEYLFTEQNKLQTEREKLLKTQLTEITKKINMLEEKYYVSAGMPLAVFQRLQAQYRKEYEMVEEQLKDVKGVDNPFAEYLQRALTLAKHPAACWQQANIGIKEKLQRLLYPNGIFYDQRQHHLNASSLNLLFDRNE
ncbi:MAG: recombinase family protein [Sediminibacterium magnilacihabitans]|jgi:site-specific DNA recombinase|nr:recombinase family protein [Sediminibacterium magnilacihabitans]PQV56514.1 DNA invertase Pin-like site-specific DNA recombinase [Sediminibacterium magnilacihabitans]